MSCKKNQVLLCLPFFCFSAAAVLSATVIEGVNGHVALAIFVVCSGPLIWPVKAVLVWLPLTCQDGILCPVAIGWARWTRRMMAFILLMSFQSVLFFFFLKIWVTRILFIFFQMLSFKVWFDWKCLSSFTVTGPVEVEAAPLRRRVEAKGGSSVGQVVWCQILSRYLTSLSSLF